MLEGKLVSKVSIETQTTGIWRNLLTRNFESSQRSCRYLPVHICSSLFPLAVTNTILKKIQFGGGGRIFGSQVMVHH